MASALPNELWLEILQYCDYFSLGELRKVSRRFNAWIDDESCQHALLHRPVFGQGKVIDHRNRISLLHDRQIILHPFLAQMGKFLHWEPGHFSSHDLSMPRKVKGRSRLFKGTETAFADDPVALHGVRRLIVPWLGNIELGSTGEQRYNCHKGEPCITVRHVFNWLIVRLAWENHRMKGMLARCEALRGSRLSFVGWEASVADHDAIVLRAMYHLRYVQGDHGHATKNNGDVTTKMVAMDIKCGCGQEPCERYLDLLKQPPKLS